MMFLREGEILHIMHFPGLPGGLMASNHSHQYLKGGVGGEHSCVCVVFVCVCGVCECCMTVCVYAVCVVCVCLYVAQ